MTHTNLRGNIVETLLPLVNEQAAELLRAGNTAAINSWIDSIDGDGDLEIPRSISISGNPVIVHFTI